MCRGRTPASSVDAADGVGDVEALAMARLVAREDDRVAERTKSARWELVGHVWSESWGPGVWRTAWRVAGSGATSPLCARGAASSALSPSIPSATVDVVLGEGRVEEVLHERLSR